MTRTLARWRSAAAPSRPDAILVRTLSARSSESTVTASDARYEVRSNQRDAAITRSPVRSPSSTATSGNTSWMLNTNGTRRARATNHPAGPSVSGGDMASTASGRRRAAAPTAVARAVKPPNARARAGMLRLSVGNGCTREMRPHGVVSVRTRRPSQPGSTSWSTYHGSAVTTCSRCPRSASSWTMRDITTPVGARSGSKWGHRTVRFTGTPGRRR